MVSPKFHKRGASRDREGLSLTPTSRRRQEGSLVDITKSGIAGPPLLDDDGNDGDNDKSTRSGSRSGGTKLKKRSKSKDTAKAAAKEKARTKLAECGYGSDGVLDDVKKRHREKRKDRQQSKDKDKVDPDAYAYPDDGPLADALVDNDPITVSPPSRTEVLKASRGASAPSLSPKGRDRSKSGLRRIANIFKSKDKDHNHPTTSTLTNNNHLDSISTLNTEETSLASPGSNSKRDNSLRSVRSITTSGSSGRLSKPKKRSNSSGPLRGGRKAAGTSSASSVSSRLSDTASGDDPLLDVTDTPKLRKQDSRSRSRSRSSERFPGTTTTDPTQKTNGRNGGPPRSLEEQVEELRDENVQLQQQMERERQRSKRLSKKLKDLRTQLETTTTTMGDADDTPVTTPTHTNSNSNDQQIQDLKHELERKDDRIVELERMVSSLKAASSKQSDYDLDGSNHDSIGSIGSCRSTSNKANDAIWHRLQTQLNETREDLSRTEELLRAANANVFLKASRVEELEEELKTNGVDAIRILKEKCNLLEEENQELETRLNSERRDFEDRMQKKDEAIIYFRNELQKLKQQGNVDLQRTLVHAASQHSLHHLDAASSHSTHTQSSSTVQRAFGGLTQLVSPALWSKDKVTMDRNSLETPRLDF